MSIPRNERELRELFDIGLYLKAISGTLEILGAILIGFVPRQFVARIADLATAGELGEDPRDFVATHIQHFAHLYAIHAHDLLAIVLALDGAMKVIVVALVLAGYRFALPLLVVALGLLGSYEAYRAVVTGNVVLAAIVVLDVLIIFLAQHEYRMRYSSEL